MYFTHTGGMQSDDLTVSTMSLVFTAVVALLALWKSYVTEMIVRERMHYFTTELQTALHGLEEPIDAPEERV